MTENNITAILIDIEDNKMKAVSQLRILRFCRGLSQDDVSRLSGVDPALVSRVERGVRISLRARAAIAGALGLSVAQLFPETTEEEEGDDE